MEPEPPPVTVVDPHAAGPTELLVAGEDREPWRWTRHQQHVALVVAAVLVLVGGVATAAQRLRDERSADRAALTSLRLVSDEAPDRPEPSGAVLLSLLNKGPHPVQLLSARLLGDGYRDVALHQSLRAGEYVLVQLDDTATCGPQLLTAAAETLRVRLRTYRDQVVTHDVALSPSAFAAVNHAARERCGYLQADEAFGFGVQSLQRSGRTLVVRALAHDNSLLPLVLTRVAAVPGLSVEVSPALPLALPVQTLPQRVSHFVPLTLRLRVKDCATFFGAPALALGVDLDQLVRGWVVRDDSIFEVKVPLAEPAVGVPQPRPEPVLQLLARSCPLVR